MINRTDIHNKMDSNLEGQITLNGVLDELLADVESVKFNAEENNAIDDGVIEVARNELTEGGFGDDETEETMELDTDRLESFFAGDAKKITRCLQMPIS